MRFVANRRGIQFPRRETIVRCINVVRLHRSRIAIIKAIRLFHRFRLGKVNVVLILEFRTLKWKNPLESRLLHECSKFSFVTLKTEQKLMVAI